MDDTLGWRAREEQVVAREAAGMAGEDDCGNAPIREPAMIGEVAQTV